MKKIARLSREAHTRKMKNADNHKNRRHWHKMFLAHGFRISIEMLEKNGRIRRVYWRDWVVSRQAGKPILPETHYESRIV